MHQVMPSGIAVLAATAPDLIDLRAMAWSQRGYAVNEKPISDTSDAPLPVRQRQLRRGRRTSS